MSKYETYFSENDIKRGLSKLILDIIDLKIEKDDLNEIIIKLLEKSAIPEKSSFKKIEQEKWDVNYADGLINGLGMGKESKEYLEYVFEVANHVKKKFPKSFWTSLVEELKKFMKKFHQ